MSMTLQSSAFGAGQKIPKKYTGDGEDVSPPLNWLSVPEETRELVLICEDPDAPTDEPWVHWVIYKIPASAMGLSENVAKAAKPGCPAGAMQGINTWGKTGYGGPHPPKGHGVHHYHFKVYALSKDLSLKPGANKGEVLKAMSGRVLAQGELVGTYQR